MMNYQEAETILEGIRSTSLDKLRQEVILHAIRYAQIRAEWRIMPIEERHERDCARSAAHYALIDACNALSRAMAKSGENTSWRVALGDDRKNIGDFACFVHCILGIEGR